MEYSFSYVFCSGRCKVGMNYVDGGAVLSGLFGLCGGEGRQSDLSGIGSV